MDSTAVKEFLLELQDLIVTRLNRWMASSSSAIRGLVKRAMRAAL